MGNVGKCWEDPHRGTNFSVFQLFQQLANVLKQHEMLREALQALHLPHLVPILALTPSCVHFASCSPAI